MRAFIIGLLLIILCGCQNREDRLLKEYVRGMWIHNNFLTDRAIGNLEADLVLSIESLELIGYIDQMLSQLKGFDANHDYTFSELDTMASLLDYKINTIEFYGTESVSPKTDDYSILNMKLRLIKYLNLKENNGISEIVFPEFRDREFQAYQGWTWEEKTFYNIPLIQLVLELKEIRLKVYQIERIKQLRARTQHTP